MNATSTCCPTCRRELTNVVRRATGSARSAVLLQGEAQVQDRRVAVRVLGECPMHGLVAVNERRLAAC